MYFKEAICDTLWDINKPIYGTSLFFFLGYKESVHKKDDEILVLHAYDLYTAPPTPYPCKYLARAAFVT